MTKQFLSESSGIADCILFSMAPLGVITAIVSVIRVAGQPWLKTIVGRGKEGRAQAELELMSSNSQDVGEMWNGQAIVRVLGSPSLIYQFVYDPDRAKTDPIKFISDLTDGNPLFKRKTKAEVAPSTNIRSWNVDFDLEIPLLERSNGTVREYEEIETSPPNLSLNARGVAIKDSEKWSLAIFGTIVQLSVLIYDGLISYHPSWRPKFPKNGSDPSSPYAFPCTAVGTLTLNIAMFACCYIIDCASTEEDCASTEEDWASTEEYWVSTQGVRTSIPTSYRGRIAWIQKGGTVNDLSFKPYIIFGPDGQRTITTSRRCGEAQLIFRLRYWVALCTLVSVAGFVVQFVGLRGMHWSASIAQLVATAILTFLRSFVRRHMLQQPIASPAIEDYELDSMTRLIGGCDVWRIVSDVPVNHEGDEGFCNNILQIRKRLGELSRWSTVSQEVAISLCTAIEQTMNIIYQSKDFGLKEGAESETMLHWKMKVLTILAKKDKYDNNRERRYGELEFHISRVTSWKPWELNEDIKGNIAGALSLWTLYTHECDRLYTEASASFVGIDTCTRVLVWPNRKIDHELFKLSRGLDEVRVYFQYPERIASQEKLPKHRFTGEYTSDSRGLTNIATVVITEGASLAKPLALQIFSDFLAEVVPLIDSISGETDIHIDDKSGKQEIRNSTLTKLVEAVSDTELGTKGELLLSRSTLLGFYVTKDSSNESSPSYFVSSWKT